jgi:hypothetical protein
VISLRNECYAEYPYTLRTIQYHLIDVTSTITPKRSSVNVGGVNFDDFRCIIQSSKTEAQERREPQRFLRQLSLLAPSVARSAMFEPHSASPMS